MNKLLSLLSILLLSSQVAVAKSLFVSPTGNDANSGTKESPFKTLAAAQQTLRKIVASGCNEDIIIFFREGRHEIDKTIVFSFEDVPMNGAKSLTLSGYDDETATLSAGRNVADWKLCSDYPEGTPDIAKGKLYVADMPEGMGIFRSMFDGSKSLQRAQSEKFVMPGNKEIKVADSQNTYYNKDRIHLRIVPFTNQIKDWDNLSDIEFSFNPTPWNHNIIQFESVDMDNKKAYLAFEGNSMPFHSTREPFGYVQNVIDYLDEAGEWCVNTKTRKIYYWPESGKPSDQIYVPQMMEMIRVEGKIRFDAPNDTPVKNINFKNLTLSHADRTVWYKNRKGWGIQHDWDTYDYGNAILRFRGAENCSVEGCRFTSSGGSAMRLDLYAQNITIRNNMIDHVGHMGILLCGYGPGTKDVNKHNLIENNVIHNCGELVWHGHAIFVWQSGENIIRHNYIHDVPRKAIGLCGVRCQILMKPENNFDEASKTIRWSEIESTIDMNQPKIIERYAPYLHARNNIVEYNHVERTMLKLKDGASINVSGAGLGNVVRYNYLNDIPFVGIRMDDWQDGTTVESNLVVGVKDKGIIYKGLNVVKNNLIINCRFGFHFRAYPKQYFDTVGVYVGNNIIYSELKNSESNTIFDWERYKSMEVSRAGKLPVPYEYNMDYNCYAINGGKEDLANKQKMGIEAHGVVMDPKFKSLKDKDYRITNKKLIKAINFKPFDVTLSNFGITSNYPEQLKKFDSTI